MPVNIPQIIGVYLSLPIWLALGFVEIAHYTALWQLKSYRPDRFFGLYSASTIRQLFLPQLLFPRLLYAVIAIILFTYPIAYIEKSIIFYAVFFSELFIIFFGVFNRSFRRPVRTFRGSGIVLCAVIIDAILFISLAFHWTLLLLLPILRFLVVSSFVFITMIPRILYVRILIFLAKKKLEKYPHLLRIGVTGSYGKTSTKTFLAHVLSSKFRVISTPENQNSDIGIARFILKSDLKKADICIVEMGAYGKKDISLYCSFIHPQIGILTGINEQHAALMGSVEAIREAKLALLRSLPKDGVAIYTADTPHTKDISGLKAQTIYTYGRDTVRNPEILLLSTQVRGQEVDCVYQLNGKDTLQITLPFPVPHYADNFCGTIITALHLGMTKEAIQSAAKTVPLPHHGIVVRPFGKKGIIIFDFYNANPNGAKAALALLQDQAGDRRKVVITRGLIELGKEGKTINTAFGAAIAHGDAELIIVAPDEAIALRQGFRSAGGLICESMVDPKECIKFLRGLAEENVAVLIENRVHTDIQNALYEPR